MKFPTVTSKVFAVCGLTLSLALAGAAVAQQSGKDAAHDRHEKFEEMGDAFEKLEKETKKKKPDTAVIQREVAVISKLGKESIMWFPVGSGPGNGFKTETLAEVWTQPDVFKDLQEKFLAASEKLSASAAANTVTHAEVEQTGETCSECHKKFRKESSFFSIFGG
jgi:cytochrome c556